MSELDEHDKPRTNRAIGPIASEDEAEAFRAAIWRLVMERSADLDEYPHLREALADLARELSAWEETHPESGGDGVARGGIQP